MDNERHRRAWQKRKARVSKRELALFRRDPHREEKLPITDYVVCRVCGAKQEGLALGGKSHLSLHGMSAAEYHKKYPGAPLNCSALTERRAVSHTGKSHQGYRVPGRPGELTLRPWLIIAGLAQGQKSCEIAKAVNRTSSDITAWARKLGIPGNPAFHDFGQPVTRASLVYLKGATGLRRKEFLTFFAHHLDGKKSWLLNSIFGQHSASRRVRPKDAKTLIGWRDELIRQLARSKPDRRAYNMASVLKTFLPNLREGAATLRDALAESRRYFQQHTKATIEDWHDWLCKQAADEKAGRLEGSLFRRFLLWAPEVSLFLENRIQDLRAPASARHLALEFLASRWRSPGAIYRKAPTVSVRIVEEALRARTRIVSPDDMAWFIRSVPNEQPTIAPVVAAAASATPKRTPLKDRNVTETTDYKLAEKVRGLLSKCEEGLSAFREARDEWPADRSKWESAIRQVGFTVQSDINAVISSKTAAGVAQRIVASREDLSPRRVQNAYSAMKNQLR